MRLILALVVLLACSGPTFSAEGSAKWRVHFSPKGGATAAITNELAKAKTSVLVQAYSFTSAPIAGAVVAAHRRGVKVQVILDKSQRSEKYSSADFLANSGVPVLIDEKHAIAHNKVIIIDGKTVITGSFNFSKAAEDSNAENLLILTDAKLAKSYTTNWTAHAAHSVKYQGKMKDAQK